MLSPTISNLLAKIKESYNPGLVATEQDSLINIHTITGKAGALYEKLRYMVDYKDERHIRRSAIERILKRKIVFEGSQQVGLSLIQELVTAGYLPNNTIPEKAGGVIDTIVEKFVALKESLPSRYKSHARVQNLIISLAASEIDLLLNPNIADDLLIDALYSTVRGQIKPVGKIDEAVLDEQSYIAAARSLLKIDNETLFYKLWRKHNPDWDSANPALIAVTQGKELVLMSLVEAVKHPLGYRLASKFKNHAIYFSVIKEIVDKYGVTANTMFESPDELKKFTEGFLTENYRKEFGRVRANAIRATMYILCTKVILAFLLELPYEIKVLGRIDLFPLLSNVLFHPLLLFFMALSVAPLGKKNTDAVVAGVENIIRGGTVRPMRVKVSGGVGFFDLIFALLYMALFVIAFGLIVSMLVALHFNMVSIILFVFFLTLVSYFGLRIRHAANKWRVELGNENVIALLWNLFTLPIVRLGGWLSIKFSSVNVFVFILDFIIETPFKLVLSVSDSFITFLKEKREDIY
jgi:hypothetical protein